MSRLLVKGGTLATEHGCYQSDLACAGDRIAEIGPDLAAGPADEVLDAAGMYVLPGGVDVHTHFDEPFMGCQAADDFTTGGRAALAGGITAHVDFAYQFAGQSLAEALAAWHGRAAGKAVIDYGFHLVITDPTPAVRQEIPAVVAAGCPTVKVFMIYDGLHLDDGALLDLLQVVTAAGGRVSVHAENHYVTDRLTAELAALGRTEPRWHPAAHPWQSEFEATVRALALAEVVHAPLYVVHMSCAQAVQALTAARERGQPAVGETSISYLALTDEVYAADGFEPAKFICSPPVRDRANQARLWAALRDGPLQVVGSDHDPFHLADRLRLGAHDFARIPNGVAGIEELRPLLWTEGVRAGRLSVERFVAVTAANPARAVGLWPRKGTLSVGADADLVVWDPDRRRELSRQSMHSAADYCLYEGRTVTGVPAITVSHGEVAYRDGEVLIQPGRGRYLPRGRPLFV